MINTSPKTGHNQGGFLLIGAVILIIFIGLIAATMAYFMHTQSQSFLAFQQQSKAISVASTGLDKAKLLISNPPSGSNPVFCQDINTDNRLNNIDILGGTFNSSATFHNNTQNPVTLQGTLQPHHTSISVNSTASLPASGNIMINHEKVHYNGKTATELLNAQRGQDGTLAVRHQTGTPIAYFFCEIDVTGDYPHNPPHAQATLSLKTGASDIWVVGRTGSNEPIVARWNGGDWNDRTSAFNASAELQSLGKVNFNNMWIVGNDNNQAAIFEWDGDTWQKRSDSPNSDYMINDIACLNHDRCFTVGNSDQNQAQIHEYRNDNWSSANTGSGNNQVPTVDYHALSCVVTVNPNHANCWAVGDAHQGQGNNDELSILHFGNNQGRWELDNGNTQGSETLRGIGCIGTDECWAVGDNGTAVHIDQNQFQKSSINTNTLHSASCLRSGECWAVGDVGVILHRTSTSGWSTQTSPTSNDLNNVDCSTSNNCWAVGSNGTIIHWDGSSWQDKSNQFDLAGVNESNATLTGIASLSFRSDDYWSWHFLS